MKFLSTITALAALVPYTTAYWKGFNVGANNPDGSCKTQADWETAFKKLQALPGYFSSVRLYASSDCNTLANAVPAALATGTQILVGVWTEDATHYNNEKQALIDAINAHGHDWIIAISVGSEDLYRGDTDANTLAQQIYDVRGMVRAMGVTQDVGHVGESRETERVNNEQRVNTNVRKTPGPHGSTPPTPPSSKPATSSAQTATHTGKAPPSKTPPTPSGNP